MTAPDQWPTQPRNGPSQRVNADDTDFAGYTLDITTDGYWWTRGTSKLTVEQALDTLTAHAPALATATATAMTELLNSLTDDSRNGLLTENAAGLVNALALDLRHLRDHAGKTAEQVLAGHQVPADTLTMYAAVLLADQAFHTLMSTVPKDVTTVTGTVSAIAAWLSEQPDPVAVAERMSAVVSADLHSLLTTVGDGTYDLTITMTGHNEPVTITATVTGGQLSRSGPAMAAAFTGAYAFGGTITVCHSNGHMYADSAATAVTVYTYHVTDQQARPLNAADCFTRQCTDQDTGEPTPPRYGYTYAGAPDLPSSP